MEVNQIYTLISAILGLITAIINRKQIVQQKYSSSSPITIGKRFKRMIMLLVAGFVVFLAMASFKLEPSVLGVTLGFFIILILYQFLAMLILMWAAMWR